MIINKKELNDKLELNRDVIKQKRTQIRSMNEKINAHSHILSDTFEQNFYYKFQHDNVFYGLNNNFNAKCYIGQKPDKDKENEKYFDTQYELIDYLNNNIKTTKQENQVLKMHNGKLAKKILKLEVYLDHIKKCDDYLSKNKGVIIKKLKTNTRKHKQKMNVRDWSRSSSIVSRMNKEED